MAPASKSSSNGKNPPKPVLKFTNSSPAINPDGSPSHKNLSGQALLQYRSEAALRLHHIRLSGLVDHWALCFLLLLSLLVAWLIGYSNASPALLALLGVAALAIGRGRWQQVVEGAGLEAELRVQRKLDTQLRGESAEWMNFLINRWWTTCSENVLSFAKNYVEPLISDLLPSGIEKVEVLEVDFGQQTPAISNMKMSDLPTSKNSSLENASVCTLVLNFDLLLSSPDSRIVLRARLGGRNIALNHLVYVNGLYLSGAIQALVTLDSRNPFPNVTKISATFTNKPDIWFSVKVLKGLKVTNIPFLKNVIHSVVMDVLTTLLVDPGKLTMNFDPPTSPLVGSTDQHAEGVLTVTLTAAPPTQGPGEHEGDPLRWISLRLGQTKFQQPLALSKEGVWQATYSFLVHDLKQDVLMVKVKLRRMVYSSTLAEHSVALDSFINDRGEEALEERMLKFSNSEVDLDVSLNYSPLPSFSLHALNGFPPVSKDAVCGVLCVHVHRGQDLMGADTNGLSDPYCIVQANKRKILRTHHVSNTLFPCWEKGVEIFVPDVTQVTLMFLVFDWDGPLVGDDLLGVAKLTLPEDCSELIQHDLMLVSDANSPNRDLALGKIVVSMVFRPVASVGRTSPECHVTAVGGASAQSAVANVKGRRGFKLTNGSDLSLKDAPRNSGVLEFKLSRGYDLVPKDSNGLSDPYVLVKYGSRTMFRSKVVKKSLNPEWNQVATLAAPSPEEVILVECWDKDIFSDDFLGSVQFTGRDSLQIFTEREQWCKLEHVKHGQLLLRLSLSEERVRWSHLDEASRQLVGDVLLEESEVGGSLLLRSPSNGSLSSSSSLQSSSVPEDSSDVGGHIGPANRFPSVRSSSHLLSSHTHNRTLSSSTDDSVLSGRQHQLLRRRHTLAHQPRPPDFSQNPETRADIQWALNRAGEVGGAKLHALERPGGYREKQIIVYHNVSGQVIEATGLKGELDHMEFYVKVRLNTRPSYLRQHKFGRGPVVHKTRVLRGSHSPQWKEDFMVKESPVASDSLLTLDLKSGSKVNIGTYAITLDKVFDGQLKATRSFDIGNDVKLRVKISRQPPH